MWVMVMTHGYGLGLRLGKVRGHDSAASSHYYMKELHYAES